jgi:DNA polymerase-3 subunit alpha
MDQIPTYARGKRDPESVHIADPRLEPIIGGTYGVILYQEQAMLISKQLAGFSGARADDLRKAIGKKNREAMAKLKPEFFDGCRRNGVSEQVIDQLWSTNEKSADYSFNKSHAACYALISYRTAWLRANYPAEYMAALISSVMDTKDKVPFFVAQAEQMGIEILPPDVNLSDHEFMVVEGNIRFGLDAVKGVGYAAVEAIKKARDDDNGGPFTSLWDFCERVDARTVNKKAIEALIKCGAFGSTGATRKGMLEVLEAAQAAGQKAQLDAQIGQASIFDLAGLGGDDGGAGGGGGFQRPSHPPIPIDEHDRQTILALEKESVGLFISEHPLKAVREALRAKVDCGCASVGERKDGDWIKIGGMVAAAKKIRTRTGSTMMFATIDDLEGQIEVRVFEKALAAAEGALDEDNIVVIRGRVDHMEAGRVCVIVNEAERFQPTEAEIEKAKAAAAKQAERVATPLHLRLDGARLHEGIFQDLKRLFTEHPGESEVVIEVHTGTGPRRLRLGAEFRVTRSKSLLSELDHLVASASLPAPEFAGAPA